MQFTEQIKGFSIYHYVLMMVYVIFGASFLACDSKKESSSLATDKKELATVTTLLKIGLEDQGEEYQLGSPIGIRTDDSKNIYIADRASLAIKMYNREGEFVKEIGRRGRGPVEFLDINTFELTSEENFFILDRGNLRYTEVTKEGEQVMSQPVDFSMRWQFYPDDVDYYGDKIIALFNDGVGIDVKPLLERELFYIYDRKFKSKLGAFFKFSEFQDIDITTFAWVTFLGKPGSFTLSQDKNELFYSLLIYHGNIYHFTKDGDDWELFNIIKTKDFGMEAYVEFDESQLNQYASQGVPGLINVRYGGPEPRIGRINTFDAGIHQLTDGRIIAFVAKWKDSIDKVGVHENIIDIYGQIINSDGSTQSIGLVTSLEASKIPWKPLVNWKDSDDNFYLLDNTDINNPSVTKFKIEGL